MFAEVLSRRRAGFATKVVVSLALPVPATTRILVVPSPYANLASQLGEMEKRGRDESERHRAESQWLVAARPLCHLQYPVAYLSRLQRILPAAPWKLYFKAAPRGSSAARASPTTRAFGGREAPTAGRQTGDGRMRRFFSLDSDLEAFSHNPAHGSFAPLAFQPSAMTNCVNLSLIHI